MYTLRISKYSRARTLALSLSRSLLLSLSHTHTLVGSRTVLSLMDCSICIYIHVYITYSKVYIRPYTHTRTYIYLYTYVNMYVYTCTHTCARVGSCSLARSLSLALSDTHIFAGFRNSRDLDRLLGCAYRNDLMRVSLQYTYIYTQIYGTCVHGYISICTHIHLYIYTCIHAFSRNCGEPD